MIGAGTCDQKLARLAYDTGYHIAKNKASLICGGLGGVMEEACRGAKSASGVTIGILPGFSLQEANPYLDIIKSKKDLIRAIRQKDGQAVQLF